MPRAGIKGKRGFPSLGHNEFRHREDGTTVLLLEGGHEAVIDTTDHHLIRNRRWCKDSLGYAMSSAPKPAIRLHRAIMGKEAGPRKHIDHANGDKLDNRRSNLRRATISQNHMNRRPGTSSPNAMKGAIWEERRWKWRSYIKRDGKQRHLGHFDTQLEAAIAYNRAARELFGEFARPNDLTRLLQQRIAPPAFCGEPR